jgi:uroporphyrinogen-III synthase
MSKNLENLCIISFESRRAKEIEVLIQKEGGIPLVAPSLREIPLEENPQVLEFGRKLFSGEIEILILLTGVGTRFLIEILKTKYPLQEIRKQLQNITLVARGPKPIAALAQIQLKPNLTVPEPNTWHEIVKTLEQKNLIGSRRIAVQEYGTPNEALIAALKEKGAQVFVVPVYRWELPENLEPLKTAIQKISDGKADVLLWTSAQQLVHTLKVARELDQEEAFRQGAKKAIIASIGPIASEALRRNGFPVDFEPSHPKMPMLIKELAENVQKISHAKQRGVSWRTRRPVRHRSRRKSTADSAGCL